MVEITKITLQRIEKGEGAYFFKALVGSEAHGRPSAIVYIPHPGDFRGGIKEVPEMKWVYLAPPIKGVIKKTARGNWILTSSPDYLTLPLLVPCGYRGRSKLTISPEPPVSISFYCYRSEVGSLGVSSGLLISVPVNSTYKIHWTRTGRLYGKPANGVHLLQVAPDGVSLQETVDDPEIAS